MNFGSFVCKSIAVQESSVSVLIYDLGESPSQKCAISFLGCSNPNIRPILKLVVSCFPAKLERKVLRTSPTICVYEMEAIVLFIASAMQVTGLFTN